MSTSTGPDPVSPGTTSSQDQLDPELFAEVKTWWIVVGLAGAALVIRLVNIGRNSLWADEAYSWFFASLDLSEIWANGGPDAHHPPLYHTILRGVMQISESEAALRFPSAVASALTVAVIFLLADRLAGRRVALFAGLLALFSPLDIWYAQEARQAAVGTLFIALAAYSITRGDMTGRIMSVTSLVAAFLTYYVTTLAWAMVLGVAVAMGWRRSQAIAREWVVATVPALAIFLLLQGQHFVTGFSDLQEAIGQPLIEMVMSRAGSPLVLLVFAAIGAAVLTAVARWLLEAAPTLTVIMTVAAFTLAILASPLARAYSYKRIVLVIWPFVIVFVAYAIFRSLAGRVSRTVQISLLAISIIASGITLFVVEKDDWRSAVSIINAGADQHDAIWMVYYVGEWSVAPFRYYEARPPLLYRVDESAYPQLAASAPGDLWIVASRTPRDPIPSTAGEAWLDENWALDAETPVHRLSVKRYSPPESPD